MPPEIADGAEDWAGMMDGSGWTPLHFLCQAVNRGHLLAEAGARRSGLDLLGHPTFVVRWLVAAGCELNAPIVQKLQNTNAVGFRALHLLAKPHHKWTREQLDDVLALAQAILQQGGRVNPEVPHSGRMPLSLAASSGQEELALLLVRYGADPAAPERDGLTPIGICRRGRQPVMASRLEEECLRRSSLESKADPRARR